MPAYGNSPLSHSHVYQQVGTWWLFSVFCLCVFVPRLQLGLLFDVSGVFAYLSLVFSPYFLHCGSSGKTDEERAAPRFQRVLRLAKDSCCALFRTSRTPTRTHTHTHTHTHTDRHCDMQPGGPLIRPSGVQTPLTCRRSNRSP